MLRTEAAEVTANIRLRCLVPLGLTAVFAACGLSEADQEDIDRWLTCVECTEGERERVSRIASAQFGLKEDATITRLTEAMQAPRFEQALNMRSRFADSYAKLPAPRVSSFAYVTRFEENYRALHQKRAALALGDIGSPPARGAIIAALASPTPYRGDVRELMGEIVSATNPAAAAQAITAVTPVNFALRTLAEADPAPTVVVTDLAGNPVAGEAIQFSTTRDASVQRTTAESNSSGLASVGTWTVGSTAGEDTLYASGSWGGVLAMVAFVASVTNAAQMVILQGNGQTAPSLAALPVRPAVEITDASGATVDLVTVTFTITAGGGSLTGASGTSGLDGIVRVGSWTLGLGANEMIATAAGLPPVTFVATGIP